MLRRAGGSHGCVSAPQGFLLSRTARTPDQEAHKDLVFNLIADNRALVKAPRTCEVASIGV